MNESQPVNPFAEKFAKSVEAKIEADKIKNTRENAVDLIKNNVDFFGGQDEERKSEIATRIFSKFGRGYTDFNSMVEASNNTSKNQRIAFGDIDSLTDSVYITMNMSVLGESLITDSMTAEQINEILPKQFKGIGEKIKKKGLMDHVKDELIEINKEIDEGNLFVTQDKIARSGYYKKLGEHLKELPENSYIRKYIEVTRDIFEDLGILEVKGKGDRGYFDEEGNYQSYDYIPPIRNAEGEWEGGSRWELSPEYAAMAMKFMDHNMRWQTYTPPEWYKKLDSETQYRIDVMIAINETASGLSNAGKDLEKILGSGSAFSFSHEKMNMLYNEDFTLVESKILHDLCEFYTDKNGISCLRYKEKFYKLAEKNKEGKTIDGQEIDDAGFVLENDRRVIIPETEENRGKGVRTIDQDVFRKLENIMDYKEELALFLSKREGSKYTWETYKKDTPDGKHKKGEIVCDDKGEKISHWMNKMSAYTAWNKVFGMGDTSVWDRMRILPTWDGIISDGVRTLNPEYKARSKWQVMKSGKVRNDQNLFDVEYFGGNMADYVAKVMKLEKDLGPIDGNEKLRDKIISGKTRILVSKTFYGMLDFVNEGRDLNKNSGRSLAKVVMDYASFDENNNYKIKGDKVEFRKGQVTFMNEFRDSMEASITAYQYMMGKADVKDLNVWARNIKDKMGMLNGITWNGKRPFSYTRDPSFWRDILVGAYGADMSRVSTDHISINNPESKDGTKKSYSYYIYDILKDNLGIADMVNINKTAQLLGVAVGDDESVDSGWVKTKTNSLERKEKIKTTSLEERQNEEIRKGRKYFPQETMDLINKARSIKGYPGNGDFENLKKDFEWAIVMGDSTYIDSLANAIVAFKP
ncbi:MAG: hypothetical protein PHH12_00415 [Candidatus Shapirobacteria bacterium]|nr:hypothetical protein [Candidatus Shapirobacteria bacterium]